MTQTRAEWLAERKTGIGGSDIASLFSVGYGCRRRLWFDKRGDEPDFPREETAIMKLGKLLESFFADTYEEKTKRRLAVLQSVEHMAIPILRVNVDRLIIEESRSGMGVLEIKSQGRTVFYKTKREGLPEDYVLQLQHGMLVTNLQWGAFAIGCRDTGELEAWDVERDEDICRAIVDEAPIFWDLVQNSAEGPERLEPDDRRCSKCEYRRTCQGNALIQIADTGDIPQAEEIRPFLATYDERKVLSEQAEELLEEAKEELKNALGDRQAVAVGERKIYFRPSKPRETWNGKDMAVEYGKMLVEFWKVLPEQAKQFHQPGHFKEVGKQSRPLRIY